MTIGNQPTDHMDEKVGWASMATVFNLRDVLQLVVDRFDDGPVAQQPLVRQRDQPVFHVLLEWGKQLYSLEEKCLKEPLGQIAFVAQQFAEQPTRQVGKRLAIIHVARRDLAGEQVSSVVDDQMEFEPIKPIHRILPPLGQSREDAMLLNAAVVTDN